MAQASVNIRMDKDLKRQFDRVCNELGMNMSTAVTIFAKKMVRENGIPFSVSYDPFYSASNMRALEESAEQFRTGHVVTKTLEELEKMENE